MNLETVFPVPTGMNRRQLRVIVVQSSVPRAHGDEPVELAMNRCNL